AMFHVRLEDEVLGLLVLLEPRIEDLFLDPLVHRELVDDRLEELFPLLGRTRGGALHLLHELLDLLVVLFEQAQRVHGGLLLNRVVCPRCVGGWPDPFRASLFGQTRPGLIRLLCWRLTGAIARLWA